MSSKSKIMKPREIKQPLIMKTPEGGYWVALEDYQALEAQAKLYEGQIESLEKSLEEFANRVDKNGNVVVVTGLPIMAEMCWRAKQALANLAEFRKKVGE